MANINDNDNDNDNDLYSPTISSEQSAARPTFRSTFLVENEISSSSWVISIVGEFPNLSFSSELSYVDSIQKTVSYSGAGRSLLLCSSDDPKSGQGAIKPEVLANLPPLLSGCRDVSCLAIEGSSLSYVFLSSESSTLVLKSQNGQLTEVIDPLAAFYVEGPTLLAFPVAISPSLMTVIQVTTSAILILSSSGQLLFRWEASSFSKKGKYCPANEELMELGDNALYQHSSDEYSFLSRSGHISSLICYGTFCNSYLAIILENGFLYLFSICEPSFLTLVYNSTNGSNLIAKSCSITCFCSQMVMAVHYKNSDNHLDAIVFYLLPSMKLIWQTTDAIKIPRTLSFSPSTNRPPAMGPTDQSSVSLLEFSILEGSCRSMLFILRYAPSSTIADDSSLTLIYYSRTFAHLVAQDGQECVEMNFHARNEENHPTIVSFIKLDHEIWYNFSYIRKSIIHLGTIHPSINGILVLGSEVSRIILVDRDGNASLPVLVEINFPEGAYPIAASPIVLSESLTLLSLASSSGLMICRPLPSISSLTPFWGLPEAKTILWGRKELKFKQGLPFSNPSTEKNAIISMLRHDPENNTYVSVLEAPIPFIIPPTDAELALAKENNKEAIVVNNSTMPMECLMTTPITVSSFLELISPISWLIIDR